VVERSARKSRQQRRTQVLLSQKVLSKTVDSRLSFHKLFGPSNGNYQNKSRSVRAALFSENKDDPVEEEEIEPGRKPRSTASCWKINQVKGLILAQSER
jgi:hypothetical protein